MSRIRYDGGYVRFLIALALTAASTWSVHTLPFRLSNGETERKYLPATVPGGLAVLDYDDDGLLDLFLANGGELPAGRKSGAVHSDRLLRNTGKLTFQDVTKQAGVAGEGYHFGAAAGDYDSDGRVDLLVTGLRSVILYRNTGKGVFEDVTAPAGLDNKGRWSVAAVWFDMENDGDQDLFVVNYVRWNPANERECLVGKKVDFCHPRFYEPEPNALFRNNGNGRFTDVSTESGIAAHKGKGMSAAAADFDGDGFTDLYVTNDRVFSFFFHNKGDERFEEAAFSWGVAAPEDGKPVSGMGVDAQDFDNDGRPDLVFTALRDETFPLFRNTGREFTEVTTKSRMGVLSRKMPGWGVAFADLDNDGWKDIAAACSDALSATGGRGDAARDMPAWFRNLGDGTFASGAGLQRLRREMYRGLVAADFDNDGCLDLALTALNSDARIARNPCAGAGNWLKVAGGKPGYRVKAGNQVRHITTAAGYASSYAGPLHFGLGQQKAVTVEVIRPGGSAIRVDAAANRVVTLD